MDNRKVAAELVRIAKDLTAPEAYERALKNLDKAMKQLHKLLGSHKRKQKTDPKSWSFVGDINTIIDDIEDIIRRFQ